MEPPRPPPPTIVASASSNGAPSRDEQTEELSVQGKEISRSAMSRMFPWVSTATNGEEKAPWGRRRRKLCTAEQIYTVVALERNLYDHKQHGEGSGDIISPDAVMPCELAEKDCPKFLIRCFRDRIAYVIDICGIMSVLVTCICAPLTFIWGTDTEAVNLADPGLLAYQRWYIQLDRLADMAYFMYLLLQLNVSFVPPDGGVEIVSRSKILRHNLAQVTYWIRLMSTMVYIPMLFTSVSLLLNNVKLVRLFSLVYIPDSLKRSCDSGAVRLTKPLFLLVICSHWMACLMSCLGGYREMLQQQGPVAFETRWVGFGAGDLGYRVGGFLSAYLMAFVEACYMLTGMLDNPLGVDSPRDKNFGSLMVVAVCGPVGCLGVALIIATVVKEHALKYALESKHYERKAFVQRALENLHIPKELRRRVHSLHFYQQMCHDSEALSVLLKTADNLNPPLEHALRVYLYHGTVLRSTYFMDKDPNYVLAVIKVLRDLVYLPGDYVARRGEAGASMYFVGRGELSVLVPSAMNKQIENATVIKTITKMDYFGEMGLIQESTRTAWVRADTYALVSELQRKCIEEIWIFFPEERKRLQEAVADTALKDRQRAERELAETRARAQAREYEEDDQMGSIASHAGKFPVMAITNSLAKRASKVLRRMPSPVCSTASSTSRVLVAERAAEEARAQVEAVQALKPEAAWCPPRGSAWSAGAWTEPSSMPQRLSTNFTVGNRYSALEGSATLSTSSRRFREGFSPPSCRVTTRGSETGCHMCGRSNLEGEISALREDIRELMRRQACFETCMLSAAASGQSRHQPAGAPSSPATTCSHHASPDNEQFDVGPDGSLLAGQPKALHLYSRNASQRTGRSKKTTVRRCVSFDPKGKSEGLLSDGG